MSFTGQQHPPQSGSFPISRVTEILILFVSKPSLKMGFNSGLVIILQISLDTTEIKVLSNHCPPHTAQTQILKPNSGYPHGCVADQ